MPFRLLIYAAWVAGECVSVYRICLFIITVSRHSQFCSYMRKYCIKYFVMLYELYFLYFPGVYLFLSVYKLNFPGFIHLTYVLNIGSEAKFLLWTSRPGQSQITTTSDPWNHLVTFDFSSISLLPPIYLELRQTWRDFKPKDLSK